MTLYNSENKMAGLIDAHCHMQDERFKGQIDNLMERAKKAGIQKIINCGTCEEDWPSVIKIKKMYPDMIIPSFGLHPWYINERSELWLKILESYICEIPSGIGEIGLDFAIKEFNPQEQKEILYLQLVLANKYKRPVSIHCRKAWNALIEVLEKSGPLIKKGLIHSYSGSGELIPKFREFGLFISFSGSITRSGNKRGRDSLLMVPIDNLIIETDSPDILPVGADGLNEPANLVLVVKTIAGLLSCSEEDIVRITADNAEAIFRDFRQMKESGI